MYPNNDKIHFAFSLMDGFLSPLGSRSFTTTQYERCKIARSKAMKLRMQKEGYVNPMKTEKLKKHFSDLIKGDNNPTRRFPEKNRTAFPVTVVFDTGETMWFSYGKKAALELGIPYSTWSYASMHNKGIPSRGIKEIIKHYKTPEQATTNSKK